MTSANRRLPSRVLSASEVRRRLKRLQDLERQGNGGISIPTNKSIKDGNAERTLGRLSQFIDPNVREKKTDIAKEIRQIKENLKQYGPRPLSRSEKASVEKQLKADEEWLKRNMASQQQFYARSKDARGNINPDYRKAVQAVTVEHTPEFKQRAERFKNARRLIDPETDGAGSIESIRPKI